MTYGGPTDGPPLFTLFCFCAIIKYTNTYRGENICPTRYSLENIFQITRKRNRTYKNLEILCSETYSKALKQLSVKEMPLHLKVCAKMKFTGGIYMLLRYTEKARK